MRYILYQADEWIKPHNVPFIYSHAYNRPLSRIVHCHDFYEIIFLTKIKKNFIYYYV
mgnify:CR=1 FL=1